LSSIESRLSKLGVTAKKSQRNEIALAFFCCFDYQVELAGIEPASKQGSLRLSTCLSYD